MMLTNVNNVVDNILLDKFLKACLLPRLISTLINIVYRRSFYMVCQPPQLFAHLKYLSLRKAIFQLA